MSKKDEALKLALEALEKALRYHGVMLLSDPPQDAWKYNRVEQAAHEAITALREALAEQPAQQGPVAMHEDWYDSNSCGHCGMVGGHASTCRHYKPTSPPASKPWVGLTDEQISDLWDGHTVPVFGKTGINPIVFARAIEAKLREKNA